MKRETAYLVYDNEIVVGITLSEAEAAYQVWQLFLDRISPEKENKVLEDLGYENMKDLEDDWYGGLFGWSIGYSYYDEYPILNELGID